MSLRFDFSRVADNEVVTDAIWQTLPFAMMVAGFGKITEKNWHEVFFRISTYEKLNGSYRLLYDGDNARGIFFTAEEVKSLIGFTVNVKDESEASWRKRILDNHKSDVLYANRNV